MPAWTFEDAARFTKKADTFEKKVLWAKTANSVFENTKNEVQAIRMANGAIRDLDDAVRKA